MKNYSPQEIIKRVQSIYPRKEPIVLHRIINALTLAQLTLKEARNIESQYALSVEGVYQGTQTYGSFECRSWIALNPINDPQEVELLKELIKRYVEEKDNEITYQDPTNFTCTRSFLEPPRGNNRQGILNGRMIVSNRCPISDEFIRIA